MANNDIVNQNPTTQLPNPNQQASTLNQPQKKGTGFTNLQRIMGASNSNRIGQAVGTGISGLATQAKQNIGQQYGQFQQKADENRLDTEANKSKTSNIMQRYTNPNQPQQNQPEQDIAAPTQEETDWFSKVRAGQYEGPKSLSELDPSNFAQWKQKAAEAESLGNLAGNAGGRQALVQRFVGTPQYGYGAQKLDTMLLGASPSANLSAARRQTVGLSQDIANKEAAAAQLANQYQNQAQIYGQQVGQGLDTGIGQITTGVTERTKQYNDAMNTLAGSLGQGLQTGTLYSGDVGKLTDPGQQYLKSLVGQYAMTGQGTGDTYGGNISSGVVNPLQNKYDPTQILKAKQFNTEDQADLARLASNNEFVRQAALEKLAGKATPAFLSKFNKDELDRRTLGQYKGTDIGLMDKDVAAPEDSAYSSFAGKRTQRAAELEAAKQQDVKDLGQLSENQYYNLVGQHTGYGSAPSVMGRDFRAVGQQLAQGKDLNMNQMIGGSYGDLNDWMRDNRLTNYMDPLYSKLGQNTAAQLSRQGEKYRIVDQPGTAAESTVAQQIAQQQAAQAAQKQSATQQITDWYRQQATTKAANAAGYSTPEEQAIAEQRARDALVGG